MRIDPDLIIPIIPPSLRRDTCLCRVFRQDRLFFNQKEWLRLPSAKIARRSRGGEAWNPVFCPIPAKSLVQPGGPCPMDPRGVVDADFNKRYDEFTSGRPDGRGLALCCRIEESPHSTGHGTGETPGRGNLPERATETDSRRKAVMVKRRCKRPPASAVMRAAR